jgi:nucleoside-diphosphate-sugar epimerase
MSGLEAIGSYRSGTKPKGNNQTLITELDLSINSDWSPALTGTNIIVHTAALVHVMNKADLNELKMFRKVNVEGTLSLARQAVAAGVKRFVFISSIKVNGEFTQPLNAFTEANLPNPQDPYSQSKYEAEEGLRQISATSSMEVVIIRPPLIYGPGVKANFLALMRAVKFRLPLPLGAVHNFRSLVGLDNLVDFILICMTHPQAANQIFLVSDGKDLSTTELLRIMAQAAGVTSFLLPIPVWILKLCASLLGKGNITMRLCSNLQVDASKAKSLLGWTPPFSVEEGLFRAMRAGDGAPYWSSNDI